VVKQADLVLAMHLCGEVFTPEQKARNFDYYEPLTVRDSSLSASTQAVIAAEVGHLQLAYDYFGEAALLDLDDLEHNTRDGLHIASLAGAWIAAVAGFGGMRDHDGSLRFTPRLAGDLTRLTFRLCFRGRRLLIDVQPKHATYSLRQGASLEICHYGERAALTASEPLTRSIPPALTREAPKQPSGRVPTRRTSAKRPDGIERRAA
jgi:alpha,alpha-trehalose phosphorylase